MHMDPESLLALLEEKGRIPTGSSRDLFAIYENSNVELFAFLESHGAGSKDEVLELLAVHLGTVVVDLDSTPIWPPLLASLGPDIARIYRCLPIQISAEGIKLCFVDPLDEVALKELSGLLGKPVQPVIADPRQVEEKLSELLAVGGVSSGMAINRPSNVGQSRQAQRAGRPGILWAFALAAAVIASAVVASAYVSQKNALAKAEAILAGNEAVAEQVETIKANNTFMAAKVEEGIANLNKDLSAMEGKIPDIEALEKELSLVMGSMQALEKFLEAAGKGPAKHAQAASQTGNERP